MLYHEHTEQTRYQRDHRYIQRLNYEEVPHDHDEHLIEIRNLFLIQIYLLDIIVLNLHLISEVVEV